MEVSIYLNLNWNSLALFYEFGIASCFILSGGVIGFILTLSHRYCAIAHIHPNSNFEGKGAYTFCSR